MGKSTDDEQTIARLRREAAREFWLEWSNGIWGLLIKPLAIEVTKGGDVEMRCPKCGLDISNAINHADVCRGRRRM